MFGILPIVGDVWQHHKGSKYTIKAIAVSGDRTFKNTIVVYGDSETNYYRKLDNFLDCNSSGDPRFVLIDKDDFDTTTTEEMLQLRVSYKGNKITAPKMTEEMCQKAKSVSGGEKQPFHDPRSIEMTKEKWKN